MCPRLEPGCSNFRQHSKNTLVLKNICKIRPISQVGKVFTNGPGDQGSIQRRVIPKTQKRVLDTSLLNSHHYKVRIKGKIEQYMEKNYRSPVHLAIEKGAFGSPSTTVANLYMCIYVHIYIYMNIYM